MKAQMVSIMGLERLGGSIGLALRASDLGLTVLGYDQSNRRMAKAKDIGAVELVENSVRKAAAQADILVLNVALGDQAAIMEVIGPELQEQTVVIDLAGLKAPGKALAEKHLIQGHYIGAKPILSAATLTDGRLDIDAASADLFHQSVFCIAAPVDADPKAVETVVNFGRILGSMPFFLDPQEYDSLVQGVETVPGLLSVALFRAVTRSQGWRDILRFAGLSFAQATAGLENSDLTELALHDRAATMRWLDAVIDELRNVRRWVEEGDEERLSLILDDLANERFRWMLEREENDWTDLEEMPDTRGLSVAGSFFGFLGKGKKD